MAHFAKINTNNEVLAVHKVNDSDASTESAGRTFLENTFSWPAAQWIQCSYNTEGGSHKNGGTAFRGNYPNIGDIWDSTNEIFHAPQPYNSWTLNTTTGLWEAPISMPDTSTTISGNLEKDSYTWDESAYQADNTTGWVKATPDQG